MNRAMKGAIVLLLACLITAGVSCSSSEEANEIKIGVIGPMSYIQGEHHWAGAQMAAEEINDAGGITLGGESYQIELVQAG